MVFLRRAPITTRIEGGVVDLTDSQFSEPVIYDDELASQEDAMGCVLNSEYEELR